jgi:phospholipid/cholesterol/gamma-HCH transport system ATP-binding protein
MVAAETTGNTPDPLVIRGLVTSFGDFRVHDSLDLTLERGKVLGVVGGSGTGKTVLMRTVLDLQPRDSGEIELFGQDLAHASPRQRRAIQARTGVLFQGGALFSALSVFENVMAPLLEFTRLSRSEARSIARLKLALVGLPQRAGDLMPSELSGGMVKRASLARALALDPELMFLDEPTAGLDPIGAAAFDELILSLAGGLGLTVFMITHDLDSLYAICDEVAVLADKRVVAKGRIEVLEKSDHPWIREYFLGPRSRAAHRVGEG